MVTWSMTPQETTVNKVAMPSWRSIQEDVRRLEEMGILNRFIPGMVQKPTTQRIYPLLRQLKKHIGEENVSILEKLNVGFPRHDEQDDLIGSKLEGI